jgi:hypothetical protein
MLRYNLLERTTQNEPKDAKMKNLEGLIMQTTGVPQVAVQQGVISDTLVGTKGSHTSVEKEVKKVDGGAKVASKGKTSTGAVGQVPYSGKMMGKGAGKGMGAL